MFAIFLVFHAVILNFASCLGPLPDASQEGLLWPWKGYASVALFHFNVPEESTRATFEFASFQGMPFFHITKSIRGLDFFSAQVDASHFIIRGRRQIDKYFNSGSVRNFNLWVHNFRKPCANRTKDFQA